MAPSSGWLKYSRKTSLPLKCWLNAVIFKTLLNHRVWSGDNLSCGCRWTWCVTARQKCFQTRTESTPTLWVQAPPISCCSVWLPSFTDDLFFSPFKLGVFILSFSITSVHFQTIQASSCCCCGCLYWGASALIALWCVVPTGAQEERHLPNHRQRQQSHHWWHRSENHCKQVGQLKVNSPVSSEPC